MTLWTSWRKSEKRPSFWLRWGWVSAFCLLSAIFYSQSMKGKKAHLREYGFRLEEMEKERLLACAEREDLRMKIASQSDPAWIEMVLMRDLGVVPEGWMKVHFMGAQ